MPSLAQVSSRVGTRWRRLVLHGFENEPSSILKRQLLLFWTFSILTAVVCGAFALDHLLNPYGDQLIGQVYAGAAALVLLNLGLLWLSKRFGLARGIYFAVLIAVLEVLLTTGGILSAGILWFYLFPPIAFYLTGRRRGLQLIGLLYVSTLGLVALDLYNLIQIPYPYLALRQLALSVLLVSAVIYLQERNRERDEKLLAESEQDALASYNQLRDEMTERRQAERNLAQRTKRLEVANKSLEETRGAMMNLLEDLGHTKSRLEEQNASISLLQRVVTATSEASTSVRAAEVVVPEVANYTEWPVVVLYERDDTGQLIAVAKNVRQPRQHPKLAKAIDDFEGTVRPQLGSKILRQQKPLWLPDTGRRSRLQSVGCRAAAGFPVLIGGEVEALLCIFHDQPQPQDETLTTTLTSLSTQLGRVIERQRAAADSEKLATIVEHSDEAIISKALDGTVVSWNRGAQEIYGYRPEEIIGKSIGTIFPDELAGELPEILATLRRGEHIEQYDTRRRRKDGRIIDVSVTISPLRDNTGKVVGGASISRDITEVQQYRETRSQLASIVESSDDAIIGEDLNGIIVSWNRGAEKIYGYTPKETVGKSTGTLIPENRPGELPDILQKIARGERIERYQTVRRRKDGVLIDVALTISPISDTSGRIIGASTIARDITEQRRVDQMKTDFVLLVSHQLKTPVGSIRGYIENMLAGVAGDVRPKQREYLEEMLDISINNYELITDLLNVSRLERGVVSMNLTEVALNDVVDFALRDYRDAIKRKGLSLKVRGADKAIVVEADLYKMGEAMRNVLNNAVKFTEHGGIAITISQQRGVGVIEVADTGVGMDKESLANVFTRRQILAGSPYAGGGAGLGMYIAKNFMNLQHGDVSATSRPGKGTTFAFSIPLAKPAPSRSKRATKNKQRAK